MTGEIQAERVLRHLLGLNHSIHTRRHRPGRPPGEGAPLVHRDGASVLEALLVEAKRQGITQAELAARCNVTPGGIGKLRWLARNGHEPLLATLRRVAGAFGFEVVLVIRRRNRESI